MINHHTKCKGDYGVLKAQVDLFEKGWLTLQPQTEHAPFDIAIWKDGVFKTVQVKYREAGKDGKVTVDFTSTWANKDGIHTIHMNKAYVDIMCIYCPETDKCYYFNPADYKKSITIRIFETKFNRQTSQINKAEDFLQIPLEGTSR